MKHLNLLFKFLNIPFLFIPRSSLRYFLLITLSLISINSTAYAFECSDLNGEKKACEAVETCTWSAPNKTCATESTSGGSGGSGGEDLEIYKHVSPQYIEGDTSITYLITIINYTKNEGNFTIHDNMADGVFSNADINITDDNSSLSCSFDTNRTNEELICNFLLNSSAVKHITYTLKAPTVAMQLENTVSLKEYGLNATLATDSVTVTVAPSYAGEIEYFRDVCYIPYTTEEILKCEESTGFLYGSDCLSEITIVNSNVREIYNLHIFKSYASEITTDSCYTLEGNVPCKQDTNLSASLHRDSSTYLRQAFDDVLDYNIGNMQIDQNNTIVDLNTAFLSSTDEKYIALIGQYNLSPDELPGNDLSTIEEYIYPCDSFGGGALYQDSSAGVNDVYLKKNTFTAEDFDVAEYIPYNTYDKIGTKIVNQEFLLGISYLNADKVPVEYNGDQPATVLLKVKANGKETTIWSGLFTNTDTTLMTYKKYSNAPDVAYQYPILTEAFKNGEILVKLVDYSQIFAAIGDLGPQCTKAYNGTGNLVNLPQCFNTSKNILAVFPIEEYPLVATCVYGTGTLSAPCDSNAYNKTGDGVNKPISPDEYNVYDGCARCLADAVAPIESSNNFATRPYGYSLSFTNAEWRPGLHQAGVNYPIELNATTADSTIENSPFYTTILEDTPPDILSSIGLNSNPSLTCPYDTNESQTIGFVNGASSSTVSYSNVGETTLTIMDQDWTKIDWDVVSPDIPECILDSNETDPTLDPLKRGRVGCMLFAEHNLTFVPFEFTLDVNLSDQGEDFTYLHDFNFTTGVPKMGADLNISIKAKNADGNVTSNYIDQCYAKENNVTLEFASSPAMTINPGNSLTHFLYYNVKDGNRSSIPLTDKVGITSLPEPLVGSGTVFEPNAPDGNGTATLQYIINFNRFQHLLVNPIHMKLSDVNLTDIDGVPSADPTFLSDNATFQYAKAIPLKDFYPNVKTSVASTPILVHVYCTYLGSTCNNIFNIDTIEGTTPSGDWWISTRHDSARDGNITMKIDLPSGITEGAGTPSLGYPTAKIISDGIDKNMTVKRGTNPTLPMTVEIELDDAGVTELSPWLIYNVASQFDIPNPFFKVRFIEPAKWTGVGATGHTVDTGADINEKKRMDW